MELTSLSRVWAPCGISEAGNAAARERRKTRRIRAPRSRLALREAAQAEHLHKGNVQIHHADAAHGAANVQIVPVLMELRNEGGEVVRVPIIGPGKDEQEEADLETERDEQDGRHFVH